MSDLSDLSARSNLDFYIRHSRPPPVAVAFSQEIRDRGSTFVATIYHARTPEEAQSRINHLRNVEHGSKPASHEIAAWRCMVLRRGRTGLAGPEDFELKADSQDDGEQWAGGKVLAVMKRLAIIDAVVVVSRWYGGILLGPVRFTHIETCTTEVCQAFKRKEEVDESLSTLSTLDDVLAELRSELAELTAESSDVAPPQPSAKRPDYSSWIDADLPRARRVISAREKAITTVKKLIAERRSKK